MDYSDNPVAGNDRNTCQGFSCIRPRDKSS
jgi:hypothetical protein